MFKYNSAKEKSMSDKIFEAMIKEALFTGEMLCSGYTQIRQANYAKRGVYFQAFTSLSTGLERIGKICFILSYAIENNCQFPSHDYIKNNVGHDIQKLYKKAIDFKNKYSLQYDFIQELDDSIYQKIIEILSRFGKGDRYANIDFLVSNSTCEDPISVWYKDIDLYLFNAKISKKIKKTIKENAAAIHMVMSPSALIRYTGEDGNEIDQVFEASYQTGVNNAVAPLRQLYVFHIIRFFVESLYSIEDIINKSKLFDVPHFMDVFRVFYNEDTYMKTRKTIGIV